MLLLLPALLSPRPAACAIRPLTPADEEDDESKGGRDALAALRSAELRESFSLEGRKRKKVPLRGLGGF